MSVLQICCTIDLCSTSDDANFISGYSNVIEVVFLYLFKRAKLHGE